jgi:YD repeat-containing protein
MYTFYQDWYREVAMKNIILTAFLYGILFPSSVMGGSYGYDNLHRLTKVQYDSGQMVQYEYDAAGNILAIKPKYTPSAVQPQVLLEVTTPAEQRLVNSPISFKATPKDYPASTQISKYDWDWNGDGVNDESGTSVTAQHTYTQAANYSVIVTANDSTGGKTKNNVALTVANVIPVDTDGDGYPDTIDNCPLISNPDQTKDLDGDKIGDVCDTDRDGDGVANDQDIFPDNKNESKDNDKDGTGDNADNDDDNDGMLDAWEKQNGFDSLNAADAVVDTDADGFNNKQEHDAGTNPRDVKSYPVKAKVTDVTPLVANVGAKTTVTIVGTDLPSSLDMQLTDCASIQKVSGATATLVQFNCTFSSAGSKSGTVRDKAGSNYTLKEFTVNVTALPDLQITRLQPPVSAQAGQNVPVTVDVKNTGSGAAAASTLKIYWVSGSVSTELSSLPIPIVAAGQTVTLGTNVTIPASAASGSYSLLAKADSENVVNESAEDNNTASQVLSVQNLPDLQALNLQAPTSAVAGQSISVSVDVKNIGTTLAATSNLAVWLSTDGTLQEGTDTLLASATVPVIAAGSNPVVGTAVLIPASVVAGQYQLLVKVDSGNVIVESNEANNVVNAQLTVTTSACAADNEPDDSSDKAMAVGLNSSTKRSICPETDVDWFKFTLTVPSSLRLETSGVGNDDTRLWLYDSTLDASKAKFNDDKVGSYYSKLAFDCTTPLVAGTYFVKVDEYGQNAKIPEYTLHVQDVKACTTDKADLGVTITNPATVTPDTFSKHTVTVVNSGTADATDVVLTVKIPADLMTLSDGSSKSKTEMVAFDLTQGSADCPLSTATNNAAPCPEPPPVGASPYYKNNTFHLGAIKAGQSAAVNVTTRYSGYDVGSGLQASAAVTTVTFEASTANNSAAKSFTVQAKRLAQGCDYENLVWVSPYLQGTSQNNFRAFLNVPAATSPLQLFGFSNSGQQTMLEGDGFVWRGAYQDGSYPSSFFAMAKAPSGSRYVGVSTNGGIYWSDDRVTWIAASVPNFVSMYDIEYSKGRYVAVGNSGVILTSTDGINWQRATSNVSSQLLYVDSGNNEFVAGGQGILLRSTDGVIWSTVSNSVSGWTFGSVWNGSQYLLFDMLGSSHVIMPDMVSAVTSFAPRIDGQVKSGSWYAVYWQDSEYVALTSVGILTSKDARDWVTRNSSTSYPYAAQRFGDKVVIAGANGGLWTGACVAKSATETKTFTKPMYAGYRLDGCLSWATQCNGESATKWCKDIAGYTTALSSVKVNSDAPTKMIGDNQVCDTTKWLCGTYSSITCSK